MYDYEAYINVDPSDLESFAYRLKELTRFFPDISEEFDNMEKDSRKNCFEVVKISKEIVDYREAIYAEEVRKFNEKTHLARGNANAYYDNVPYEPVTRALQLLERARTRHQAVMSLCDNSEAFLRRMKNLLDNKLYELGYLLNEGAERAYEYYDHVKGIEQQADEVQYIPGVGGYGFGDNKNPESSTGFGEIPGFSASVGGFSGGKKGQSGGGSAEGAGKNFSAIAALKGIFGSNLPQSTACSEHSAIPGLAQTNQQWHQYEGGVSIFNTPEETGKGLDFSQGKKSGYASTCGCVSCVNVLRLAGVDITEETVVEYASTHTGTYGTPLCETGNFDPFANGGTTHNDRKEILAAYGVESELVPATKDDLVKSVCAGKGVIASVRSDYLYYKKISALDLHAVTVTSIGMKNGKPYSVFVCDSNGLSCVEYPIDHFIDSLTPNRPLNVTTNPIR